MAIHAGKEPFFALSVLEKSLAVLASALEKIRVDVFDLGQSHADLAGRFLELSQMLDAPIQGGDLASTQVIANRRDEASVQLDGLILEIRKHPGFSDWLEPSSADGIRAAAIFGPIVVVNLSKFRCDAILVEKHQIRPSSLPNLTNDKMNEKESQISLASPYMLEWLWNVTANPILQALGIEGQSNSPSPWY
ncbi:hypothetical protein FGADI_438 [Fusarium gaditjirri]|uniref:Uncharacterized protein n=1 Tax=Fusarium gaditjirri TaxID=282569 RepID=A0A8H4X4Z7_9HYPO|nr:hypothetical protein FGADI_438 [Fusarium gaditjirri]